MEIRRIEYGEVITQPGIYDIPLGWYHDQCCEGFSVSSSGIRTVDLESGLHFWDRYVNPDREEDDPGAAESVAFRLGRAGHTLMLEPETFEQRFLTRPSIFDSWRTEDAKKWRADAQRNGITVLDPPEMVRARGIGETLRRHRWHTEGILSGVIEASLVCQDPKTGIWLKSRPDAIPLDSAFSDLKCMLSAHPDAVERSIRDHAYDIQMALAGVCLEIIEGRTIDHFWLVAVESRRPHAIHVETMAIDTIYWARVRIRRALDLIALAMKEDYWPAFGQDGRSYVLPKWRLELYDKEQNSGLLPKEF